MENNILQGNGRLNPSQMEAIYTQMHKKLQQVRREKSSAFLTLTEKILYSHLCGSTFPPQRGEGFLSLKPDRVIMQDATAQMALLQFMLSERQKVAVPSTVHCDHLIQAFEGVKPDMEKALSDNQEVFEFLSSVSSRYGIGFWGPGAGIIHQVVLENYAFPGALFIGTDSHTPNAGGLGAIAVGVGGADGADVMAGLSWEVKHPRIVGVHLKGSLKGWTCAKDIILKLLSIMTVKGGTNKVIEYFGEGCKSLSCTGKATITNMGAELGATSSVFPYDFSMEEYLQKTGRSSQVEVINRHTGMFVADQEVLSDPHAYYDEVVEIDLDTLEPYVAGPHSPDAAYPLSEMKERVQKHGWPVKISAALIGSCTNSSYEDIGRASCVARQAARAGFKMPQYFLVTPGSDLIKKTIERDGYMKDLKSVGALVLANACGPCIGQWKRKEFKKGTVNTIVSSFNRNFPGRNDANPQTLSFLASPEVTMALGLAGRLDFNPLSEELCQGGKSLRFQAPRADVLPEKGFMDSEGYQAPKGKKTSVLVSPHSERLQILKPFDPWDGKDFLDLLVLCHVEGKCTTDHISPAGFWLRYRGHLDRISDNLLLGATDIFTKQRGTGCNHITGKKASFSEVARSYKSQKQGWLIVGAGNYGEGSSREHAAMSPRFLGAKAVLAQSFARIHETNLKKQGILPFVFEKPEDKQLILEKDRVHILNLKALKPKSLHPCVLKHADGSQTQIMLKHSLNEEQVKWFQAGSALNLLRAKYNAMH